MYVSDFSSRQLVEAPLDEVFDFFSNARNLERLTPPWLSFEVLAPGPIDTVILPRG